MEFVLSIGLELTSLRMNKFNWPVLETSLCEGCSLEVEIWNVTPFNFATSILATSIPLHSPSPANGFVQNLHHRQFSDAPLPRPALKPLFFFKKTNLATDNAKN